MEIKRLKVTPAIAAEWLENANIKNRTLSKRNVEKFANDMKSGKWMDTHQNIIAFYEDGSLADGQHRLAAIVEADQPLELMVARDIKKIAGGMIDQGRTRSVADAMRIGGFLSSEKYTGYAVAIVKVICAAEAPKQRNLSILETAEYIEKVRDGVEFACSSTSSIHGSGLKNAVVRSALTTSYYFVESKVLERFVRVLVSGMPFGPEDAIIIRLRNWLMIEGASGGGSVRIGRYQTILKVIKLYASGEDRKVIRKATENTFELGIF